MKIGILTFHCAYNFGAILQSYALYSFLKLHHYNVEMVNYCPPYLETKKTRLRIRTFLNRSPYRTIKLALRLIQRDKKYISFISNNMTSSIRCDCQNSYNSVIKNYDVVIIGSDQVWNTTYNGKDPIWYGKGVNDWQNLLAYAVSAGDPKFTKQELEDLKIYLKAFSNISVREECLASVITPLTSKPISTVLDPSLMAPTVIWKKWMSQKAKKSIVIYQARINDNVFRIAESLSKKTGYPIIAVDFYANSKKSGYFKVVSPEEFFILVNNAYCVITTSFHGTAFSIITNTPFYTLRLNDGADARSEELLERLGAIDRMIDVDAEVAKVDMDFTSINIKLDKLRKESQEFLLKGLQK